MPSALTTGLLMSLLVSLRIAPTLAFAPPFTLLRVPAIIRVLLSMSLAGAIVFANPDLQRPLPAEHFIGAAFAELFLGVAMALSLQLAFAALLTVGRTIDFQVGFGFALLADPTLRTQMPLVGTLLAYAAGAVFFFTNGPADLVAIWAHSTELAPPGDANVVLNLPILLRYTGLVFALALGLAGLVLLALFLADLAIAAMSRTLPQMNVLVLGFQVKTVTLLLTLPFVFALSGSLFLRILRLAIDTTPRFT